MDKQYEELYNKLTVFQRWDIATQVMWDGEGKSFKGDEKAFFDYLKALPESEGWEICEKLDREGLDAADEWYDEEDELQD